MEDINNEKNQPSNTETNTNQVDSLAKTVGEQTKVLQNLLERSIASQEQANKLAKSARFGQRVKTIAIVCTSLFVILGVGRTMSGMGGKQTDYTMKNYVNMVELDGTIGAGEGISAEKVVPLLEKAYSDTNARGVILKINSPGGSPVQSSIIHDRIVDLKNKYKKKTVVVGEDIVASGGYFIAVAADEIVVNRSTLIGSIGVIHSSFGFSGLMDKLGVERRITTAGESKSKLDPFMPIKETDKVFLKTVLAQTHEHFKDVVKEGRKDKLNLSQTNLFDGTIWTGDESIKVGIADKQGDLWSVLKDDFGSAKVVKIQNPENIFQNIVKQVGVSAAETFVSKIKEESTPVELK